MYCIWFSSLLGLCLDFFSQRTVYIHICAKLPGQLVKEEKNRKKFPYFTTTDFALTMSVIMINSYLSLFNTTHSCKINMSVFDGIAIFYVCFEIGITVKFKPVLYKLYTSLVQYIVYCLPERVIHVPSRFMGHPSSSYKQR